MNSAEGVMVNEEEQDLLLNELFQSYGYNFTSCGSGVYAAAGD
ncbi:MAG: hypothetical protein ACXWWC_10880 [Chitinophagaceae bacterium]